MSRRLSASESIARGRAMRIAAPLQPDRGTVIPANPGRGGFRPVDEAANDTPQHFVSIMRAADIGQTRQLIDLGKSSRKRDDRLDGVAAMRVLVIASRRWSIKPAVGHENDSLHKRRIAAATQLLSERRVGFTKLRQHLAHGVLEPHAVLEHNWYVTTVTTTVGGVTTTEALWNTAPEWKHPRRFVWRTEGDRAGELCRCDIGLDPSSGVPLSEYPAKFVVHTPVAGSSDYAWMRGALRPRLAGSLSKRKGVRWWLSAIERYGQPQLVGTVDTNDTNLVAELKSAMRNIGPDWRAIVPNGVSITPITGAEISSDLHQKFVDWQNTSDAIRILGQNLSTEVKGGSYAAATSQERVRADILAGDLAELDETINDQWLALLWHYNWPGEPVGVLETQISTATPWTIADYQAGLCTRDDYAQDNGHDPEPDGKGARYYTAPQTSYQLTPSAASGGGAADIPFKITALPPNASPTSSTSPSTTHPLRSALSRK